MHSAEDFQKFLHPNKECKCCHSNLQTAHPSVDCTCCIVEWEKTDGSVALPDFILGKLRSAAAQSNVKTVAKLISKSAGDFNISIQNENFSEEMESILFDKEPVRRMNAVTMAEVLADIGVFPSRGQARKAGWDRIIPPGFVEFKIGKVKNTVTIWNPIKTTLEQ